MRTIIVSLSLLAVVLAYIVLSPSYEPTKTTSQETVGEGKKAGGNAGKTTSPRSARQKASEADWAAVHAIAAEYAPQLAELEHQRSEFKARADQYRGSSLDPNSEWSIKKREACDGVYNTEKAIRDVEREQWARMSEHLSPYELRKYRISIRGEDA